MILNYPKVPTISALISQLAEIGVRTTFMVIASTAALLYEELDEEITNVSLETSDPETSSSYDHQRLSKNLDNWKAKYDLVCRFTEQINRCFGLAMLLTLSCDYLVAIIEFQNILLHQWTRPQNYFNFIHIVLRFLLILIASYRLEIKVLSRGID